VLAATLEDGSSATINARCVQMLIVEVVPSHVGQPAILMESVDPYWVIV